VGNDVAVSGRLVLERYNLAEQEPHRGPLDVRLRRDMRRRFEVLYRPQRPAESVA